MSQSGVAAAGKSLMMVVLSSLLVIMVNNTGTAAAIPSPTPAPVPGCGSTTKLVDEICKKTSNYNRCVETLYGDPRTGEAADSYTLAYVSFGLAYANAVQTRDRIAEDLLNPNPNPKPIRDLLLVCQRDYKKAVNLIESALNDLNSETFFTLASYADRTSLAAHHCLSLYPSAPFSSSSSDLISICEICTVIAHSFTPPEPGVDSKV